MTKEELKLMAIGKYVATNRGNFKQESADVFADGAAYAFELMNKAKANHAESIKQEEIKKPCLKEFEGRN